jgi:2-amino-4-hydroxy-6-hydroxymethyldihydropteridine diphosphokinase
MSASDSAGLAVKTRAVLAFGSNLGSRKKTINTALKALDRHPKTTLVATSPFHETVAITLDGPDESQPRYLNAVAIVETKLNPKGLHELCQEIENKHGRVRLARWAPRTLDIDIITYGAELVETSKLIVPHPRAHERIFVLEPWLEIDPDAVIPGKGRVEILLANLKVSNGT